MSLLTTSPRNRYLDLLKQGIWKKRPRPRKTRFPSVPQRLFVIHDLSTNSPVLGIKSHTLNDAKRKADSWAALHGLNSSMVGLEEVLRLSDIQRYSIPVES